MTGVQTCALPILRDNLPPRIGILSKNMAQRYERIGTMSKGKKVLAITFALLSISSWQQSAFAKDSAPASTAPRTQESHAPAPAPAPASAAPAPTRSAESHPTVFPVVKPSPVSSAVAKAQSTLSTQQQVSVAEAKAAYKSAAQQALDGANRAVADAKSLLQQELAAAGKDKTLKALALAEYKKNTADIWSAFKKTTADAKAALDSATATVKSSTGN